MTRETWNNAGNRCPMCQASDNITSLDNDFDLDSKEWNRKIRKK